MRGYLATFALLALVGSFVPGCKKATESKEGSKDQAVEAMDADDMAHPHGMRHGRGMRHGMGPMEPGDGMGPIEPGDGMGPMGPGDGMEPMGSGDGMEAPRPTGDAPKTMTSKDGAVTVTVPAGEGWDCVDQQGKGPGGHDASLVKCRRADRREFFFMMAKVYGVGKAEVKPAKELATKVFMATYQKLFASHKIVKEGPARLGGLEGWEISLEMTHARMGDLKKTERVFTKGEQVFVLSGEGKADVVARFEKHLEDWFSTARFKALAP